MLIYKVIGRGGFLSGEFVGQAWEICAHPVGAPYGLWINDEYFASGDMKAELYDELDELGNWYFKY